MSNISRINLNIKKDNKRTLKKSKNSINYKEFLKKHKKSNNKSLNSMINKNIKSDNKVYIKKIKKSLNKPQTVKIINSFPEINIKPESKP